MKQNNKHNYLMAIMLAMALVTFTACGGNKEDGDNSSSYEDPYDGTSSSREDFDTSSNIDPMTPPYLESSGSTTGESEYPAIPPAYESLPESGSSHPNTSGSQSDSKSQSQGASSSDVQVAQGNDFSELGALDKESKDWGPGGPVDEKNRSTGALGYNEKYKDYNTLFIGPDEQTVYLTFDEGYEYGLSGEVLDTLKEKKVSAMFFITYDFAKQAPEMVQRMIDEGHSIGNHSYTHDHYTTLTPKEMADDMMKMHDYVKTTFDYEMEYFRFPAGNFNEQCLALVEKMGYKTLFWSFAYKDWIVDEQPDPVASTKKIVDAVCPGNIYLLHAVSATNNQILGDVIDGVVAKGYTWGDPTTL